MKAEDAIQKLRDVIRRKHFSLSTEDSYCGWLKKIRSYIKKFPPQSWPVTLCDFIESLKIG